MNLVIFGIFCWLRVVAESSEVKIAHLLPVDANTIYEANVMQMCIEDLKNRSILPMEINLK